MDFVIKSYLICTLAKNGEDGSNVFVFDGEKYIVTLKMSNLSIIRSGKMRITAGTKIALIEHRKKQNFTNNDAHTFLGWVNKSGAPI